MSAIDLPAHVRPVRWSYYAEVPEENGACVGYGDFSNDSKADPEWVIVEYASFSDYSGNTAERSNYRVLLAMLEALPPETPLCWARCTGGYGTQGLLLIWSAAPAEIRETIEALEDYPIIDESDMSALECELTDEAWESYGRDDLLRALRKAVNDTDETLELDNDTLWQLYRVAEDRNGEGYIFEQGAQAYFDWDRAVPYILESIDNPSRFLSAEQVLALETLGSQLTDVDDTESDAG